jgi:hypothetical protein
MRDRASYDRDTVNAILDEGLLCHLGFSADGSTVVLPTTYARVDNLLYVHGASANHMLRVLAEETPACVSVTLLDGLVLARASFHHSMNYRSVVIFSIGQRVDDPEEKRRALDAIVEHVVPGRTNDARPPNDNELRATLVVRLPIEEFSAKIRVGPPIDDDEDGDLPIWAGIVPFQVVAGPPIPDPALIPGVAVPSYATRYPARRP